MGLDREQWLKLRRTGAPFSIVQLIEDSQFGRADALLAGAGVHVEDLPRLRHAAQLRVKRLAMP
jgi:hypothetical protein